MKIQDDLAKNVYLLPPFCCMMLKLPRFTNLSKIYDVAESKDLLTFLIDKMILPKVEIYICTILSDRKFWYICFTCYKNLIHLLIDKIILLIYLISGIDLFTFSNRQDNTKNRISVYYEKKKVRIFTYPSNR